MSVNSSGDCRNRRTVRNGRGIIVRSNLRQCADAVGFTASISETVRVGFAFDVHRIIARTSDVEISGATIRNLTQETAEKPFDALCVLPPFECLANSNRFFATSQNLKADFESFISRVRTVCRIYLYKPSSAAMVTSTHRRIRKLHPVNSKDGLNGTTKTIPAASSKCTPHGNSLRLISGSLSKKLLS